MNNTRNYGIDLLRLVSMYLVVILHILGHGGGIAESGINFYITWFFETAALCAVDCFAIISGYVGYSSIEKKGKIGKIIGFWVQVFFWSFGITLLLFFLKPGEIEIKDIIKSALPISSNAYWYASSYIPVLIFSPWMNKFIAGLDDWELEKFLAIIGMLFSVYYLIAFQDPFRLGIGYSAIWLVLMYLVGAGMRRLEFLEKIKANQALIILIFSLIVSWVWKCFSPISVISLLTYTSPTILTIAIMLICVFSKINLKGSWVKILAPAAFGVYLIHDNNLIRSNLMSGTFAWITKIHPVIVPFAILGSAFAVFIVCICIERLRLILFEVFGVNKLIACIGNSYDNKLNVE